MAEMDSLRELYVEEIKDLWSAENQILKGLPRMIKAAKHPQLKRAFTKHEAQTQAAGEAARADLQGAGREPARQEVRRHGRADRGGEGPAFREARAERAGRGAHQRGAARRALRDGRLRHRVAPGRSCSATRTRPQLLQQTLDEEKATDLLLTDIAENQINIDAEEGDGAEPE